MQLTKLEIKGFKSFGDKVTINFDEGITGIVGPNGCGKSNVVDSIRWVLGEQSTKALRSEKMENVIFNGTKNRKPLQMAEVSLTFNNTKNLLPTEYSYVTITRRYFRSGDSEYLLNNVTCRLKDIHNLFLDTGIGSDSYAIIELKMVDDILNDKDNSRRGLFEEAAGISKFKIRKKQTLKKLEDTDKDLERVEDLLFEINKNLKSLEKQAKQTEKYFQIKEEYKNVSIDLARVSIQTQKEEYQNLTKQLDESTDKKITLATELAETETSSEKEKNELVFKEKQLASRQKALNEHVNKIRNFESEKKIKNERLRYLSDRNSQIQEQIDLDKKSNERAEFSLQSLQKEKEVSIKLLDEVSIRLDGFKSEFDEQKQKTQQLQEELAVLTSQHKRKQEEVYELNKQLEIFEIQYSTLKQEYEKTSSDDQATSISLEEFEQKLELVTRQQEAKNEEFEALQKEEEEIQNKIKNLTEEIEEVREKLTQLNRKLDARQNEYNLTKSMVDNLEGFPEAIKFLKKNSAWGKDAPLLSDLLTCDEKYRLSIENFMESYMNYYVVENEAHAYQAVNLLNDASKGKANFFILSAFENFQPSPKRKIDNCIPAIDIAEFDSKYANLVNYILNDVYIVVDNQEEVPKDKDVVFITQNGKITKRKFSITGGSVGLFEGKRIGRAKNLEKLDKEIKDLHTEIADVKSLLESKQKEQIRLKESTKKEAIESTRKELNLINQEFITVKTKKEQFASLLNNNALKKEDILERINSIEAEKEAHKPKAEAEKAELSRLEESLEFANEELTMQNTQLSQKSSIYNEENILFHQQQNKVNSLEQEISYKQSSYDQSKERIEKNIEESKRIEDEIKQVAETADLSEDELIELYQEKERMEQGVNEAEKEYYAIRGKIDEAEKSTRELRNKREAADQLIHDLQSKLNENKLSLTSMRERLAVEFNIDLDDLLSEEKEIPFTLDELKQKVQDIKNKLDKMGPINPMAMEAYQEIQERHTFITTQKADLVNAKESLMATINEIDTVAKDTFMDSFIKIRENFIKVFRSLFTEEDSCDLKLADPDHPLESTIDIIARPKGKRPLTINQLSGGEKTLTAISLLFAIYLLKPAPFCIFDEVDAPLDDANIDKFNNIIRKFAGESQFIIVTHNKRTMASTDVIYGVTMIEQGVSRLVPVDLRSLAD